MTKTAKLILASVLSLVMILFVFLGIRIGTSPDERMKDQPKTAVSAEMALETAHRLSAEAETSWQAGSARGIVLSDTGSSASVGVQVAGSIVTVTSPGVYVVEGCLSNGQLAVDCTGEVILILKDAEIRSLADAAIHVIDAGHVLIYLPEGSVSRVVSGTEQEIAAAADNDTLSDASGAALYAKDCLSLAGTGTITAEGYLNNGIATTDHLVVLGGTLDITAANNGLKGKDSVTILDGILTIQSGNDGIKSDSDTESDGGNIDIRGGEISVSSLGDGIHAGRDLSVSGGIVNILAGDGAGEVSSDPLAGVTGGDFPVGFSGQGNGTFQQPPELPEGMNEGFPNFDIGTDGSFPDFDGGAMTPPDGSFPDFGSGTDSSFPDFSGGMTPPDGSFPGFSSGADSSFPDFSGGMTPPDGSFPGFSSGADSSFPDFSGGTTLPGGATNTAFSADSANGNSSGTVFLSASSSGSSDRNSQKPQQDVQRKNRTNESTGYDSSGSQSRTGSGFPDMFNPKQSSDSDSDISTKGLKCGQNMVISGGTVTVDSSDDSVHADGSITVLDGTLALASGDDGIHANDTLTVNNGSITVSRSFEGLEAHLIYLNGGNISITASDDGVNANGGASMFGGFFGGWTGSSDSESDTTPTLQITGGTLYVNAAGDGLDSNGDLIVEGGCIIVEGPTDAANGALDSGSENGGKLICNGGTILAIGASGMAETFEDASAQCSFHQILASTAKAGTLITVADENGSVIFEFTSAKSFRSVVFSSPQLTLGKTYTLSVGEEKTDILMESISNGVSQGIGSFSGFGSFGGRSPN